MTNTNESTDQQVIDDLFAALTDHDTEQQLHSRLVDEAQRDGVLDVSYRTIDSPVGS